MTNLDILAIIWSIICGAVALYAVSTWRRRIAEYRFEVEDRRRALGTKERLMAEWRVRLARRRVRTSARLVFTLAVFSVLGLARFVYTYLPVPVAVVSAAISVGFFVLLGTLILAVWEEEQTDDFINRSG